MSNHRGGALVRMLGPAACLLAMVLLAYGVMSWFVAANLPPRKVSCLANMKQLENGLRMYISDYDEKLPPARNWQDGSVPYVKNWGVYVCPSRMNVKPGYAFNQPLDGIDSRKAAQPEQIPMLFESNRGQRNGADQLTSFVTPHPEQQGYVGFLDGHVKAFNVPPAAAVPLKQGAR